MSYKFLAYHTCKNQCRLSNFQQLCLFLTTLCACSRKLFVWVLKFLTTIIRYKASRTWSSRNERYSATPLKNYFRDGGGGVLTSHFPNLLLPVHACSFRPVSLYFFQCKTLYYLSKFCNQMTISVTQGTLNEVSENSLTDVHGSRTATGSSVFRFQRL